MSEVLEQFEVDALLAGDAEKLRADCAEAEFADRGAGVAALVERLGRDASAELSGYLRCVVRARLLRLERGDCDQAPDSPARPVQISLSPQILHLIVSRLVGDGGSGSIPSRPLTPIERGLVQPVIDRVTDRLERLAGLCGTDSGRGDALAAKFQLKMADVAGEMNIRIHLLHFRSQISDFRSHFSDVGSRSTGVVRGGGSR